MNFGRLGVKYDVVGVPETTCAINGARHRVNSVTQSGNVLHSARYWRGSTRTDIGEAVISFVSERVVGLPMMTRVAAATAEFLRYCFDDKCDGERCVTGLFRSCVVLQVRLSCRKRRF
jgi:hypothetical protein